MSSKFALIIGNTEYTDPGLAQLTAPGEDVEDFARVLKSADIAGFDKVITLINENISKVNETVDDFFALKKPDDLLVFYFSGHGVRDEYGALYLAIKNTNRSRLRSTAIRADYIRESMDQSRSRRQVLILDCCNSGAFAQGTKAEIGGTMGIATTFEGTGYGRVVLTASDATQFAWEGDKVIGETTNSLFTHFLVKGLEGEADQDGDGKITVDELYDYAYEEIVNITPKQTPGKWSYKQQGEIVLRQSTRMENIKPVSLPDQLTSEIENPYPEVRLRAVLQLAKLLSGKNLGLARSAREALERIEKEDDSRRVAQAATQILESTRQAELLAMQKAEEARKAHEEAEAERIAMQKAEEERLAREKAEQEQLVVQKAEAERVAREKAERERLAQEKSEAERLAAKKAEEERLAHEKAEQEQLVAQKAEAERVAREKVERESLVREKAEAERLAQEKIERERLARQKAEREAAKREAAELAAHEAAEKAEQKATRRKTERESAARAAGALGKTASSQPALQRQPILKWAIIGIIGLCVVATGAWGISYFASLGVPAPTEGPQTKAPATDIPTTKEIATERTNTRVPTVSTPDETLQQSAIWSNFMSCQKAASGILNINSPWLSNDIMLDGKITTTQEWADAVCLDLTMDQPRVAPATLSSRWWFKNDAQWLYLLVRVSAVASFGDSAFINYFWPYPFVNRWEHSDYSGFGLDGIAFDGYGWDNANWSDDTLASPPGENNVKGGARGDTTYIWFEFKKALNSGDGYDWDWALGQTLGTSQNGSLGVGIYDSTLGTYFGKSIQLHLGTP